MSEELKFCKDCKHFLYVSTHSDGLLTKLSPKFCNSESNIYFDMVMGTKYRSNDVDEMRKSETLGCTISGKWFESK